MDCSGLSNGRPPLPRKKSLSEYSQGGNGEDVLTYVREHELRVAKLMVRAAASRNASRLSVRPFIISGVTHLPRGVEYFFCLGVACASVVCLS